MYLLSSCLFLPAHGEKPQPKATALLHDLLSLGESTIEQSIHQKVKPNAQMPEWYVSVQGDC